MCSIVILTDFRVNFKEKYEETALGECLLLLRDGIRRVPTTIKERDGTRRVPTTICRYPHLTPVGIMPTSSPRFIASAASSMLAISCCGSKSSSVLILVRSNSK